MRTSFFGNNNLVCPATDNKKIYQLFANIEYGMVRVCADGGVYSWI